MLGLTSYQEALRALGRLAGQATEVQIVEDAESGWLEFIARGSTRRIDAAELEDIVVSSVAQRGKHRGAGETADVLRAGGLALDELHALGVCLVVGQERLSVRDMMLKTKPEGAAGALLGMAERDDQTSLLSQISCPALILVGREDPITPVRDSEKMNRAIAGSRLVVIDNASHVSNLERTDQFNEELVRFLNSLS